MKFKKLFKVSKMSGITPKQRVRNIRKKPADEEEDAGPGPEAAAGEETTQVNKWVAGFGRCGGGACNAVPVASLAQQA